jgi:hypothetical protein
VQKIVISFLFGIHFFTKGSIFCSGSFNNFCASNSDKNPILTENRRLPIKNEKIRSVRFNLTNVQKFFDETKISSEGDIKWFESFTIYVKSLDKPLNMLKGVISVDQFCAIEDIIQSQEKVCQSFLSNCFYKEDSTDSVIILAKFAYFLRELNKFIETFDLLQYHWERLQNEIIDACKAKMAKIESVLVNIAQTDIFLESVLERKKKQHYFSKSDTPALFEYEKLMKEYELKMYFKKFVENEFKHVANYISFFSNSFRNIADKLKRIETITATSNPENLGKIVEDLFIFFRLFDSNEEDSVFNLIKKVKEMNIYLFEELEKYDKRYSSFLKKLEDLIPKLISIEQSCLTHN